jgi:hypothetical protein
MLGQPPLLGGRADLRQHLFGRAAFVLVALVLLVRQVLADPPLPFLRMDRPEARVGAAIRRLVLR